MVAPTAVLIAERAALTLLMGAERAALMGAERAALMGAERAALTLKTCARISTKS